WFALQLVDRRGAVSTNDFEALRHSLQALVSLRNGELAFPDVAAMGEQARALDDFCAQLDLQLALNVLDAGNGAFAGTKVRGLAEAAGMRLASGGEFQAHDENGNFLFALANMGEPFEAATLKNLHTHGLTFLLDVPHVRDGGYAFERMLASARQFANALDAALVNAQRAPVSEAMVDSIRKKIFEIHEQMNLAGIPAGGVRALRLFA
ncbi:MAG TPA: cell division protein ZipA C-terminal FtsZ-binding domain-containing protein, partial [Rhodocyclaceae bacterium]|nr:cell division protein ZipA C-terminal FtsZ-binding domain-containing protein [Rhodocyclaceae bacterium]